jgi:hypothetical protein
MGAEVVPGIDKAIETEWQERQAELARLVPGGRRVVAEQSDHMIPTAQPGLVVDEIEGFVDEIEGVVARVAGRLP